LRPSRAPNHARFFGGQELARYELRFFSVTPRGRGELFLLTAADGPMSKKQRLIGFAT
jgi:hypothetical protein